MIDTTLELALDFLRAHPTWYIFPITRLEKFPPHIKDNLNLASNDPKQIKEWHARWRGCNWGLASRKSKVIVVDVDTKDGKVGQQTIDNITLEYGELPETLTVRSPSGGFHYYYEGEHRFGLGKHGFGVDVDSPNYVLLPGCWLCSNSEQGYEIVVDVPVAQAPDWFGIFLRDKSEKESASAEPAVDLDRDPNIARMIRYLMEGAPKCVAGQNGNKTLYDVACVLKDNGVSEQRAVEILATYYNTPDHCEPLWLVNVGADADRLDIVVGNAYRYSTENQAGEATAEYAFGDPADKIEPSEVEAYAASWNQLITDFEPDRQVAQAAEEERKRKKRENENLDNPETAYQERTTKAFGEEFDDLTGEPIDPLTGKPFDDDTPPAAPSPPKKAAPPDDAKDTPPEDEIPQGDGGADVPKDEQKLAWVLANWVWIVSAERFMRISDGVMWSTKQFDSYYNNLCKKASFSAALFASDKITKVEKYVYRPGKDVMLNSGRLVNLWRPSKIVPKQGDTTIWNEHIDYLFGRDAQGNKRNTDDVNHVLNWMAWVYRNMSRKPNHGLLIVGKETGTGKSFVARVLEQLVGTENTQRPKNSSLKGDFNAWANTCKLCIIEELMQIGRREVANELRDTITESTIEVNIKNITAQKIENYMAMMGITNHRDAMPMEPTERRWLVIETPALKKYLKDDEGEPLKDDKGNPRIDKAYYNRLWTILEGPKSAELLAAIGYELQNRDVGDYNAALPPPETDARGQMIELSRSDVEHWLYENSDNAPLSNRLTTVADVIEAMPTTIQRTGRLRTTVQTYMRDKLGGVPLRPVRLTNGVRVRLWALNGLLKNRYNTDNMTDTKLGAIYEADRRQGGSTQDATAQAAEDFDE